MTTTTIAAVRNVAVGGEDLQADIRVHRHPAHGQHGRFLTAERRTAIDYDSEDDGFYTTGGMSLVRTVLAIAAVWSVAIAAVIALGS